MAGLFPGVCNAQNIDGNGQPLKAAVLSVYLGGTLTLANCFQDIGLAIPAQNPMTADATTGRLPIFYVADGVYRVRLIDQSGLQVYDYPQIASIGASSSGGGGSAVDPTTVFQTGDPIWLPFDGLRSGWVRMNGRTLGSATSGATERGNADCQNLFLYIWNNFTDALCPVVGGRGANAAADWTANRQITTLSMRGRGPYGLDTMGNAAAGVLTLANLGVDPTVAATAIGEEKHTLATGELPSHTHTGTTNATALTITTKGRQKTDGGSGSVIFSVDPASATVGDQTTSATVPSHTHTFTSAASGGGNTHNTTPPGRVGTWYWKL